MKKRRFVFILVLLLLFFGVIISSWSIYRAYDRIRYLGKGPDWQIPSRIYSSETPLTSGINIESIGLEKRLKRLRYQLVKKLSSPGSYRKTHHAYFIYLREFGYPNGSTRARKVKLALEGNTIKQVTNPDTGRDISDAALEPEDFAAIYDQSFEDRTIIALNDCPKILIDAIIATEDRRFYDNWGIDLRSIFRAGVVNLKSGGIVEGGSTLTQQLVKNLFLTSDRTFSRKIKEVWMSIVLNLLYSKEKILEMYVNEVYLGRRGNASICGFGMASRVYFAKDVNSLSLSEAAFLAGIIRSPNRYSPWKHPEEAKDRRDTVLSLMLEQGLITEKEHDKAMNSRLGVAPFSPKTRYAPYFVDYILNLLEDDIPGYEFAKGDYSVFTTLDMNVQLAAETSLEKGLASLSNKSLQAAVAVVNPNNGDVLAMAGGRSYAYSQFNRAVQMKRQVGSVIKPFVYYAGIKNGHKLNQMLDDSPFFMPLGDGTEWSPNNFDNESHGEVTMAMALIQSYNIATVRLGLETGLSEVADVIRSVCHDCRVKENPSLLLGAMESSPLETAIMFSAFANGGFRVKPFSIKAVKVKDKVVYRGKTYSPQKTLDERYAYLVDFCLMEVMRSGTGKTARDFGMPDGVCGKTGSTNDLRDSWFAGFTRDAVVVSWVGLDNFAPTGLTGATGAMPIASRVMSSLGTPKQIPMPDGIVLSEIDPSNGLLAHDIPEKITMAFISGTEPTDYSDRLPGTEALPDEEIHEKTSPDEEKNGGPIKEFIKSIF